MKNILLCLSALALVVCFTEPALAQTVAAGDGIVDKIGEAFSGMGKRLSTVIIQFMTLLFTIDVVFTFGRAIMSGSDLGAVVSKFMMRFAFLGAAWFFAQNADAIVKSLIEIAHRVARQAQGGSIVDPSVGGIFSSGIDYAVATIAEVSIWEPLSVLFVFVALAVLGIAAFTAGMLVLVYAEFYIISFGGLIVLGFAGLSSTKSVTVTYFKSVLGQALKLLGFLMTYTIMQEISLAILKSAAGGAMETALLAFASQILLVVLLASIPSSMMGLAGGISAGGASEMMARAGAQVATAAASAGAGAAVGSMAGAAAGAASGGAGALAGGGGLGSAIGSAAKGGASGAMSGAKSGLNRGARIASMTSGSGVGRATAQMIDRLTKDRGSNGK